jgi:hypothetical protein
MTDVDREYLIGLQDAGGSAEFDPVRDVDQLAPLVSRGLVKIDYVNRLAVLTERGEAELADDPPEDVDLGGEQDVEFADPEDDDAGGDDEPTGGDESDDEP